MIKVIERILSRELCIKDFAPLGQYTRTLRLKSKLFDLRPVILHVSQEDTSCPTSLCDALTEQSALARLNASIQTWLCLIM